MKRFILPKSARLKSQKIISETFEGGNTLQVYPLRIHYVVEQASAGAGPEVKVAFTVSRRNFRKAVDRNRIKRLMREAYRLNQFILKEQLDTITVHLVFLYYIKDELSFSALEKATQKLLNRLVKELLQTNA